MDEKKKKETQPNLGDFFHKTTSIPMRKSKPEPAVSFYLHTINDNGCSKKMLTVMPNFYKVPSSFTYEITGSEGFLLEGTNNISKSSSNNIPISFYCKTGQTYFTKIIAYYLMEFKDGQPQFDTQEYRFFYKVNDDFDDSDVENAETESDDMSVRKMDEQPDSDNETEVDDVDDVEADGEKEIVVEASDEYLETVRQKILNEPQSGLDLGTDSEE